MLLTALRSGATPGAAASPTATLEPLTFPEILDDAGSPKTSRVRAVTGRVVKLLKRMQAGADQGLLWDAVAELLPDLTRDEVDRLTIHEASDILAYASGQLAAVEAAVAEAGAGGAPTDPPAAAA